MNFTDPMVQVFWNIALGAVSTVALTVKNLTSAKNIVALLQHGIDVLTVAKTSVITKFPGADPTVMITHSKRGQRHDKSNSRRQRKAA